MVVGMIENLDLLDSTASEVQSVEEPATSLMNARACRSPTASRSAQPEVQVIDFPVALKTVLATEPAKGVFRTRRSRRR